MSSLRSTTLGAVSLLSVLAATPAFAEVSSVTLSSGGLAEIIDRQAIDGAGDLRLKFPADQLDDVLKSLVVRDPGGAVVGMRLDGPQQAEETLRRMPFKADDVSSPARLLNALQGLQVSVEFDGQTIRGRSLGVSERNGGQDAGAVRMASVLGEDGAIQTVRLGEGATVRILDEDVAKKLAEAASALGRAKADGSRFVEIGVAGSGRRDISISYVVPAPVWKTAYRVMSGDGEKARLQAWAIIENATSEDWKGVAVTLQTGAPVTLRQRLMQRYWRARPEVPVDMETAFVPDVDPGAAARRPRPQRAEQRAMAAPAPYADVAGLPAEQQMVKTNSLAPAPVSEAASTAAASEADVSASYRLPEPVDLGAGQTLSTPIVDADVPAERVSVFKGDGVHPVAAISIKNDTKATLPPGIITVYDQAAGYVGDARLPATPAGEQRMASFATDRKVTISSETRPEDRILQVRVADGVAHIQAMSRETTEYAVKGAADGPRTIVIEHPKRAGWELSSPASDSETPAAYRLKQKLEAGGEAIVKVVLENVRVDEFALSDAEDEDLVRWSTAPTDAQTKKLLTELAAAKAAQSAGERDQQEIDEKIEELKQEQARARENLRATDRQSELGRRFLKQIETVENQIADQMNKRDEAGKRISAAREQVRAIIGKA